jgi:hypothetical protein
LVLGLTLAALQVDHAGLTIAASHGLQMKLNVFFEIFIDGFEQIASELFTSRTTQSMSPPNSSNRMRALISTLDDFNKSIPKRLMITEFFFDRRHELG